MNYRLHRRIYLRLYNKVRLPRKFVTAAVKTLAWCSDPRSWWVRRAAAAEACAVAPALRFPETQGYLIFSPGQLPHTDAALSVCRKIYADKMASGFRKRNRDWYAKPFLVPLTDGGDELLQHQGIRDFVLSPELISLVCRYFRTMPILAETQLLWTPANSTQTKSQKYHLDAEDYQQLKLFLHIDPVDPCSGPFTLISAEATRRVCAATGYVGGRRTRLEDEDVERIAGDAVERAMGDAGSGILVDTSRCLHYGSRRNRNERLVLFVQFISYYAPKLEPFDWKASLGRPFAESETERLLLRL